jgi:hypothetical protein
VVQQVIHVLTWHHRINRRVPSFCEFCDFVG